MTLLVLLFVATWRVMGPALPIISGTFLAYCLFGQYLPAPLDHRGYDFAQVIDHMTFGTEGVYGIPTYVSSSYIFLFILFGSFLEKAGMITLFTDIALGLFGSRRGGPAKVAVVASGLMGTISGSGVANVVTTGQFTIPLMMRFGYRPAFAGGVEATASMGGQIMPPVMGAVAFIMAETLDVPYADGRQGRGGAGDPVFPVGLLDGAPGGRPGRSGRPAGRRSAVTDARAEGSAGT